MSTKSPRKGNDGEYHEEVLDCFYILIRKNPYIDKALTQIIVYSLHSFPR